MSAELMHACAACGAEESLDALLQRMVDDDIARRLIADVITQSLPLGALVMRYLRLHKPAKQRLRMSRIREVLAELVPDLQAERITRKGREWRVPIATWQVAFHVLFDNHARGQLRQLEGNAYLYEVAMRQVDRAEAEAERARDQERRSRAHVAGTGSLGDVIGDMDRAVARASAAVDALVDSAGVPAPAPAGPSMTAGQAKERLQEIKRRQLGANLSTNEEQA